MEFLNNVLENKQFKNLCKASALTSSYLFESSDEDYLNSLGVCVSAELIRREDIKGLGCGDACIRCHGFTYYCITDYNDWLYGESTWWVGDAPIYQDSETTDPFQTGPGYFSTGSHYFFNQAPVVRVTRYDYGTKNSIRPVITLDLGNTCIKEEKEEVKGVVEEVKENPKTGSMFIATALLLLVLLTITGIVYFNLRKVSYYK